MIRKLHISALSIFILTFTSCIQFEKLPLDVAVDTDPYYKVAVKKNADYQDKFTATDIMTDMIKNTWGFEKDACREFVVVDSVKKAGASSIYMSWDKSKKGCDWIGGGIAWNNWQVVDMSDILGSWGLRFYVRTVSGKMPSLSMFMNFIDESNKSSETIMLSPMFYEGSEFNTQWKEVIIPLSYFRIRESGLNPAEVKQLIIAFDGTAKIFLDEMQLIKLDPTKYKVTTSAEELAQSSVSDESGFTTTDIYTDMLKNTWGTEKDSCREFNVVTDVKKSGAASLHMKWNKTKPGCGWLGIGWNWNNWTPVDMSQIIDSWAIRFYVRTVSGKMNNVPFGLLFQDKAGKASETISGFEMFMKTKGVTEEWNEVVIPLKYFNITQLGLNPQEIQQVIMTLEEKAEIYLDEFQLVPYKTKQTNVVENDPDAEGKIFSDKIRYSWGFEQDECKNALLVSDVKKSGNASLKLRWNCSSQTCKNTAAGFTLNKWNPVDVSQKINTTSLQFSIRVANGSVTEIPLSFSFADIYVKESAKVTINNKYYTAPSIGQDWVDVTIPLKDFKMDENGLELSKMLQVILSMEGSSEIFIDDIFLIEKK